MKQLMYAATIVAMTTILFAACSKSSSSSPDPGGNPGGGGGNVSASGKAGTLDWKISENGAFSISGSGAMPNYTGSSNVPWDKYRASIKSVTIGSDVTSIGNNAFKDCTGITGITIGSGVKSIGNFAFNGCSGLTSVTIHATTPPALADGQFYGGSKMTLYVPKSNTMVSGVPQYVDAYQKVPAWGRSFGNIAEQK